jgi:hypothetical protein
MNFYGQTLYFVRTTSEKLASIEKQLADNIYPVGSSWHQLLVHLQSVYTKRLAEEKNLESTGTKRK